MAMNQSVTRCLDILEYLGAAKDAMLITDIAKAIGLSLGATHHMMNALRDRGYISHVGPRRGYTLGPSVYKLQSALNNINHLVLVGTKALHELYRDCDEETCYLSYFNNFSVENLDTIVSSRMLSLRQTARHLEIIHAMAQGKVLLASLSAKEYADWKSEHAHLEAFTEHTIVDFGRLDEEISRVRRHGYAENVEETEHGVYVAAAPIANSVRTVGCISVGVPLSRLTEEKREAYAKRVSARAAVVSDELRSHPFSLFAPDAEGAERE